MNIIKLYNKIINIIMGCINTKSNNTSTPNSIIRSNGTIQNNNKQPNMEFTSDEISISDISTDYNTESISDDIQDIQIFFENLEYKCENYSYKKYTKYKNSKVYTKHHSTKKYVYKTVVYNKISYIIVLKRVSERNEYILYPGSHHSTYHNDMFRVCYIIATIAPYTKLRSIKYLNTNDQHIEFHVGYDIQCTKYDETPCY